MEVKKKEKNDVTYKMVRSSEEVNLLIERGNEILGVLGYTEHSRRHAAKTAETAAMMDMTPINVRVRVHRSKAKLREALDPPLESLGRQS